MFVDEAHDLHPKTLVGLKRLVELVQNNGGALSVVLVGHPKLRNDLRRRIINRNHLFQRLFIDLRGYELFA